MVSFSSDWIKRVVDALMINVEAKRATAYISPTYTIKATRQHRFDKRLRQETFLITLGQPNYAERKFIKLCKKVGEPFPVKRIQVK